MPIISDNTWFCLARKWSSHTAWVCPVPPAQQTLDNIPYVAVTFGIVRMLSKRITWLKSILKYWNSIRLPFAPTKSINLPCACAPGLEETWSMPTSWRRPHLQCPFPEKGGELFQPGFLISARIGRIGETNGRKGGLVMKLEAQPQSGSIWCSFYRPSGSGSAAEGPNFDFGSPATLDLRKATHRKPWGTAISTNPCR